MKTFGFCLIAVLAAWMLTPGEALACSCMRSFPDQVVDNGDLIGEGTVVSVETESGLSNARLELTRVWKGPQLRWLPLRYPEGDGGNCGPNLKPGQSVALYAFREQDGSWTTSTCSILSLDSFMDPTSEFGKIALPLLEAYRSEGLDIAAAIKADPLASETGLRLARHQEMGGKPEAALATYRRILVRDPGVAAAHAGSARILIGQENRAEALAIVRDGLRRAPTDQSLRALERELTAN